MPPAIRVENLGKSYRLGLTHAGSVRELANRSAARIFRRNGVAPATVPHVGPARTESDGLFWALRDVSFEIEPGEVVGIIGKNGAGKSTLLKILSRITPPTTGRARVRGRVASLLEVGTGFHPELTGRENVFLNGTLLGMRRREVVRKLDEIVAFAEVEQFLDTPVKRYSSGMTVRLAFSVAAHLEPEILIVDEVLAVGDMEFQKKCLGKIENFSNDRRTVLFVSHNIAAIKRLCTRCIVLTSGTLDCDGPAPTTTEHYLARQSNNGRQFQWTAGQTDVGETEFRFLGARLLKDNLRPTASFKTIDNLGVQLQFKVCQPLLDCRVGFIVSTADGTPVFASYDTDELPRAHARPAGESISTCTVPLSQLLPGRYIVSLNAGIPYVRNLAYVEGAVSFELHDADAGDPLTYLRRHGIIRIAANWTQS